MNGATFLGVDGGGTKTSFVLIDGEGHELARHLGPTSYHLQIGMEGLLQVLADGVAAIAAASAVTPSAITHAFIGLPAFGEDSRIDGALARLPAAVLGHERFSCGNDMICGWAGSLGCDDGINVVAGTGSIAYGERRGQGARSGGWGEYFGDEGSGYWIALRGLQLFARMSDGRAPIGPLHAMLRERFALGDDLDICGRVMGDGPPARDAMADLAKTVAAAAEADDSGAIRILADAGDELADLAEALRRRLGFADGDEVALSWSGSVLGNQRVRRRFRQRLEVAGPAWRFVEPLHDPAMGAAIYARHLAKQGATLR